MDLTSILNNSDDRDPRPRQASESSASISSSHQSRRQPPPPLSTHRSPSNLGGYPLSAAPAYDRQPSSAIPQSPGGPYSASSHTPTPHSGIPPTFPSPYARHAPLPSPSQKPSVSTPSSYFASNSRPLSNHSAGRTSSSPYDHPSAYPPAQSPTTVRQNSYHNAVASPVQPHPQTPLAPPPLPRAESSQSTKDGSLPYLLHHRSPSGTLLASPHRPSLQASRSYSYSAPDQHALSAPSPHINGSPDQSRRRSSGQSHSSQRHHSVSVSPKTVVQALPHHQHPYYRPTSEHSHVPPSLHHANSEPQAYVPPKIIPSKAPPARSPYPLQPAPEIKKEPGRDAFNSQPSESKMTPKSQIAGIKRSADGDVTSPAPVKRPRKIKEPPIWATKKRGLKPMSRQPQETNGETKPIRSVAGAAHAPGGFEPSITNVIPREALLNQVCMFLYSTIFQADKDAPFEIEAKIGTLCDPDTSGRIRLPVTSEVILDNSVRVNFESLMDESHHQALNKFLNQLVVESKQPHSNPGKAPRVVVDYKHTREVDELFNVPPNELQSLSQPLRNSLQRSAHQKPPRVRITKDEQGKVLARIVKSRVADMNIYCPGSPFDFRISINLEQQWSGDMSSLTPAGDMKRHKDRLSYTHQWCQVDLTQVGTTKGGGNAPKIHELEVELDAKKFGDEGRLLASGQENIMEDVVRVFLDNVRTLARYVPPRPPGAQQHR